MLAFMCCRGELCRAASESDSENDGNPYRAQVQLEDGALVDIRFAALDQSDSLDDADYYEQYGGGVYNPQQCTTLLEMARREANDALVGPPTEEQLRHITLCYEAAIGAADLLLKRRLIREYDSVRARHQACVEAEQQCAGALVIARSNLRDEASRRDAYRRAIRSTSRADHKKALKKEYNAYARQTRASAEQH